MSWGGSQTITERVLALICRLTSQAQVDVVNALDVAAVLDLGNEELMDCVDDLVLLGLVEQVIGAEVGAVTVRLTAVGAEGCKARFRE